MSRPGSSCQRAGGTRLSRPGSTRAHGRPGARCTRAALGAWRCGAARSDNTHGMVQREGRNSLRPYPMRSRPTRSQQVATLPLKLLARRTRAAPGAWRPNGPPAPQRPLCFLLFFPGILPPPSHLCLWSLPRVLRVQGPDATSASLPFPTLPPANTIKPRKRNKERTHRHLKPRSGDLTT